MKQPATIAPVTVPLGDELVEVDLVAPGASVALYRREWSDWAFLATCRRLDEQTAYELAQDACVASIERLART